MKGIKVEGMDHLAGQLKRVMATAQGQELQAALLAAAEEIRGEAARRAPIAPYPTRQNGREIAPGGLRASLKRQLAANTNSFCRRSRSRWRS
jgi:hypothetical protein